MFSFFSSKKKIESARFGTDMHSHLLPGIDDGVKTLDEAAITIRALMERGYKKAITTPHIMSDTYRNTPAGIREKLEILKSFLKEQQIDFEVDAAAEYYLDESLMRQIADKIPLLTFGKQYLLFETNYLTEPYTLKEFIFNAIVQGYRPVLAHPERYHFMSMEKVDELLDRDVLLQCNLLSLSGFYGKPVQHLAEKMIAQRKVHFLGTDCHNPTHAGLLATAFQTKAIKAALDLPLLNYTL